MVVEIGGNEMTMRKITFEQFQDATEAMAGYCIECGAWRDCCEPDAREYLCQECGAKAVYGAEELLIMGLVQGEREC